MGQLANSKLSKKNGKRSARDIAVRKIHFYTLRGGCFSPLCSHAQCGFVDFEPGNTKNKFGY